ncbi:MAG TPA: hypothetical protein ENI73_09990 [Spirochaetes bacterium]|nr:hypothetical protein [Spirochaetota bacterium]
MDVSNLGLSPIRRTNESFFRLDKRKNILKKNTLRRGLTQAKQHFVESKTSSVATSFKTSTKIALAEAYINSGKFFAAEQVLNEVSQMVFATNETVSKKIHENARISSLNEPEEVKTSKLELDKKILSANKSTLKKAMEEKAISKESKNKLKEYLILNEIKDKPSIESDD